MKIATVLFVLCNLFIIASLHWVFNLLHFKSIQEQVFLLTAVFPICPWAATVFIWHFADDLSCWGLNMLQEVEITLFKTKGFVLSLG